MTIESIHDHPSDLEQRVSILENDIAVVKQILAQSSQDQSPWWLKVAGSFEDDPTFDEVVQLGREWRTSP